MSGAIASSAARAGGSVQSASRHPSPRTQPSAGSASATRPTASASELRALEPDLPLSQRPGREVHVGVVEAGQHAAALEVHPPRVRAPGTAAIRPSAIASRSTTGAAGSSVRIVPPSRRMGRMGRYSITKRRKDVEREVASKLRVRLARRRRGLRALQRRADPGRARRCPGPPRPPLRGPALGARAEMGARAEHRAHAHQRARGDAGRPAARSAGWWSARRTAAWSWPTASTSGSPRRTPSSRGCRCASHWPGRRELLLRGAVDHVAAAPCAAARS